jgi:hypothetical protein
MPNFFAAAQRHFDDGDFLHQHARHSNAVQLWAYGGECTLKAIGFKRGYFQLNPNGKPDNNFGQHLNQTIKNVPDLLSLYNAKQTGTNALMGPLTAFVGWDINARYEDGSHLQEKVDDYKNDAMCFRAMLNNSVLPEGM